MTLAPRPAGPLRAVRWLLVVGVCLGLACEGDEGATPAGVGADAADAAPDGAPAPDDGAAPDGPPGPDCPEALPGAPAATAAADSCADPLGESLLLVPGARPAGLSLTLTGASSGALAGEVAGGVTLWRFVQGALVGTDTWPAGEGATPPLVAALDDGEPAVVWGDAGGVRYGRPGEAPVTLSEVPGTAPLGVLARQGGSRVLVRDAEALQLLTVDHAGGIEGQHLVNAAERVAEAWSLAEDTLVVMPFAGPEATRPLGYQTTTLQGGQCSLPVPFGLEAGPLARGLTAGLSYGWVIFAWRDEAGPGCAPRHRVFARTLSGEGFAFDSPLPFGDRVALVAAGPVAMAVTVAPDGTGPGWRVDAQAIDLVGRAPGAPRPGFAVPGEEAPAAWAVGRNRGRYVLAWAAPDGVRLRGVCF